MRLPVKRLDPDARLPAAAHSGDAGLDLSSEPKDVADILGHKSITTTLIYAKLDLKALMQVALPWPGGVR